MKDQYFGDVNDYLKYGLLRVLVERSGLSLGVCWLRTADDDRTDGEFRRYLSEPVRWRGFDPDLYDGLRKLLDEGNHRTVEHAENWRLLPDATYHHAILTDQAHARATYFASAHRSLANSNLWFFDPDNGLEVPSKGYGTKKSSKFLFWPEVVDAFMAGTSVVIYQHFPREARATYTARRLAELRSRTGATWVAGISTARVLFLVAAQESHAAQIATATELAVTHWDPHLTLVR